MTPCLCPELPQTIRGCSTVMRNVGGVRMFSMSLLCSQGRFSKRRGVEQLKAFFFSPNKQQWEFKQGWENWIWTNKNFIPQMQPKKSLSGPSDTKRLRFFCAFLCAALLISMICSTEFQILAANYHHCVVLNIHTFSIPAFIHTWVTGVRWSPSQLWRGAKRATPSASLSQD